MDVPILHSICVDPQRYDLLIKNNLVSTTNNPLLNERIRCTPSTMLDIMLADTALPKYQ